MSNLVADYVQDIAQCKTSLVEALVAKGLDVSVDDTFASLAGKVNDIHSGVTYGSCLLTVSNDTLTLNNLPFRPIKIGIASQELLTLNPVSTMTYITLCSVENNTSNVYDGTSTLTGANVTVTTVENAHGLFDVTIHASNSLVFKAYYTYTWVACSEGFSLNGGF